MVKIKAAAIVFFSFGAALAIPAMAINSASSSKASVADSSNPYGVIVDRNIFRLNDPPPPPDPASQKKVELPKVNLNGIFKVGDDMRALFSIPPKDAKSTVSYFKLAPGEKDSDQNDNALELVKIHADEKQVDIVINGTAMTLDMASNAPSVSPKGGGPAPAQAAVASASAGGAADSSRNSPYRAVAVAGGAGSGGGNDYSSGNSLVAGGANIDNSSTSSGSAASAIGNAGISGPIASALLSGNNGSTAIQLPVPTQIATPEQQAANMIIHAALNGGSGPPLPPPIQDAADALSGGGGKGTH